jgi:hypothetical protein
MNWKNITSYSQGQKDHPVETTEIRPSGFRIVVTRLRGITGKWFLSCEFFDRRQLTSEALEDAQAEAVALVKERLTAILADLS